MSAARGMRLAIFPMLPSVSAATRTFCERPVPYLADHGIEGRVFMPSGNLAYARLNRSHSRFRVLLAAIYWYGLVAPRRLAQLACALRYDVILIQRSVFRVKSPPILEGLLWLAGKLLRMRIVYHLDDALYTIKPRSYRLRLRFADLILTGNREIAAYAAKVNRSVRLFDGPVDVERYPVRVHECRSAVVIGWVGHAPDLDLLAIVPALAEVCRSRAATIHVVSDRHFSAPELAGALRWHRWDLDREFSLFEEFDIGIAPLTDCEYNRAREAFKIKEYMAAGLPVVCSPVGHNREVVEHGVTGYFARTEEEWLEFLLRLVDDAGLRARLGTAGRRAAIDRYAMTRQAHVLGELLWTIRPNGHRKE